jgi:uncharacterized protein (TIGR02266 family)
MSKAAAFKSTAPGTQVRIERRRSKRAPVVVRIDYSTVDALFSDFSRDINEGGLFIETDQAHELDARVMLQFRLPGSEEPIKARGRVVWIQPPGGDEAPGIGVLFEELDESARSAINRIVRQLRSTAG